MSSGNMNSNIERFEQMWNGITPKGVNRTKGQKFRQYILEHVRQTGRPMNKEWKKVSIVHPIITA